MGKNWDKPDQLATDHDIEEEAPDEAGMPVTAADKRAFQKWAEGWLRECHRILKPGGLIKVFGGTRMFHRMGAAMQNVGFLKEPLEAWGYGSGFPKSMNIQKVLEKQGKPEEAKKYAGWGTAIKPSWEPFLVGRKRG